MTYYHFLSSLRQGLAAAIDSLPTATRAEIQLRLDAQRRQLDSGEWDQSPGPIERTVQLYGPGDIAAFDERMIIRREPKPNSGNFEPNYFPAVEFGDPDFPWRFTPEPAAAGGSSEPASALALTPWIVLIVLVAEDREDGISKEYEELPRGKNQRPAIRVFSQKNLPNLKFAWRWAHVQAITGNPVLENNLSPPLHSEAASESMAEDGNAFKDIKTLLATHPALVVSRLLCPRRLRPRTRYGAFIVPTYKLGWAAALDTPAAHARAAQCRAIDLAWDSSDAPIDLPYFHQWEFRTSVRGDFEHLVRMLEPRDLSGLGLRDMDCERPGFGLGIQRDEAQPDKKHLLAMEGALQSLDTAYTRWGRDKNDSPLEGEAPLEPEQFQAELAHGVLNRESVVEPQVDCPEEDLFDPDGSLLSRSFAVRDEKTVQVNWHTASQSIGIFEYGAEDDTGAYDYDNRVESTEMKNEHSVVIELVPERTYHFRFRIRQETETITGDATICLPLPAVVPPIYGKWHAARQRVLEAENTASWLDELNLDPRHRAAAGLGAETVRKNQEALMASAWDQIGEIEAANDILRRAQISREISHSFHRRLQDMAPDDFIRITAPVQKRVVCDLGLDTNKTIGSALLDDAHIPAAAMESAFRRIGRVCGPIRKRQTEMREGSLLQIINRPKLDLLTRLASDVKDKLRPAGQHPVIQGTKLPSTIERKNFVVPTHNENSSISLAASIQFIILNNKGILNVDLDWEATDDIMGLAASGDWSGNKSASGHALIIKQCAVGEGPLACQWTFGLAGETKTAHLVASIQILPDPANPRDLYVKAMPLEIVKKPLGGFLKERISFDVVQSEIDAGVTGIEIHESLAEAVHEVFDTFLSAGPTNVAEEAPSYIPDFLSIKNKIMTALAPSQTALERIKQKLRFRDDLTEHFDHGDPLDEVMAYPEFPQPMCETLKELSESHVLPGVEKVPQNTVGVLEPNRRFIESYMAGLNHEFARELLWRRYPTDQRGSYFRQFWNVDEYVADASDTDESGNIQVLDPEALRDIKPLHKWKAARLGANAVINNAAKTKPLVLMIRGNLIKRYPNALVYAVGAQLDASGGQNGKLLPGLNEFGGEALEPQFPVFRGALGEDLIFMGFSFDADSARSVLAEAGHYTQYGKFFVFEERIGEARFGLDEAESSIEPDGDVPLDNLSWGHFQLAEKEHYGKYLADVFDVKIPLTGDTVWNENTDSGSRARITLQKSVRLAIHADQLLP